MQESIKRHRLLKGALRVAQVVTKIIKDKQVARIVTQGKARSWDKLLVLELTDFPVLVWLIVSIVASDCFRSIRGHLSARIAMLVNIHLVELQNVVIVHQEDSVQMF